jgi:hypothetical protein
VIVLVAYAIAPPVVGYLSDTLQVRFGDAGLGYAMLLGVPMIVLSSIQYFRAANGIAPVR